jgi:NAD-dependent deacetylase
MAASSRLIAMLRSARAVAVLTGAGVSAESGVPTFRGENGLWRKFRPEELANFEAFIRNPQLVWEWYKERKRVIQRIQPNPGHIALAELEKLFPDFSITTQNIDNLHRRAGSKKVFELHGNIERNYCVQCRADVSNEKVLQTDDVPRCEKCGGLIRPDVVWFGELLPSDEWESAETAARHADVYFSIGTSAIVYPAASLPLIAKRAGAFLVEINPEETALTPGADEFIEGNSGAVLPQIVEALKTK